MSESRLSRQEMARGDGNGCILILFFVTSSFAHGGYVAAVQAWHNLNGLPAPLA